MTASFAIQPLPSFSTPHYNSLNSSHSCSYLYDPYFKSSSYVWLPCCFSPLCIVINKLGIRLNVSLLLECKNAWKTSEQNLFLFYITHCLQLSCMNVISSAFNFFFFTFVCILYAFSSLWATLKFIFFMKVFFELPLTPFGVGSNFMNVPSLLSCKFLDTKD